MDNEKENENNNENQDQNENKSQADIDREKIAAANKDNEENQEGENNEEENNNENENDENEDENSEENQNENDEEKERQRRNKEKEERQKERTQKRINKANAEAKAAKEELEALKQQIANANNGEKPLTKEDIDREAKRMFLENQFVNDCNKLFDAATKIDKNFKNKIDNLAQEVAPIPGHMVGILTEFENAGAVLNYLADNVDDYDEIHTLSPARMATKLAKISLKLEEEGKSKPKPISKVPPPNRPVNSNARNGTPVLNDKMTDEEWIRARNKQVQDREERRRKGYR